MKRLIITSTLCFAAIIIGAIYILIDGIICCSYLGITLSFGCMTVLYLGLHYFKKMIVEA